MSSVATLLNIIIAILLPPLAVFIVDGISASFFIDILLTIFAWLPGVLYALYVILSR